MLVQEKVVLAILLQVAFICFQYQSEKQLLNNSRLLGIAVSLTGFLTIGLIGLLY